MVFLVLVALVAGLYIGPIVKIAVEQVVPNVAKVSIKVEAVDVSLLSGSAVIKGLVVGNPLGYTTPQAISVDKVAVSLEPLSVITNKILIYSVHVESPDITFEGGLKGNNLKKIMENVDAFSNNMVPSAGNAPAKGGSDNSSKSTPKIEVDDLLITGAKVHVQLLSVGSSVIPLPDIHLTNIGKNSNGVTPAQLTSEIIKVISMGTIKAITGSKDLTSGLKKLGLDTLKFFYK